MKQLEIEARGRKFPVDVEVSPSGERASFAVQYAEDRVIRSDTWETLRKTLTTAVRKAEAKLSIKFTSYSARSRQTARDGTVYAVHASNDSPMVEWEDGSKGQLDGFAGRRNRIDLRPLTDVEKARLEALRTAHLDAQDALEAFEAEHSIDIRGEVRAALMETST